MSNIKETIEYLCYILKSFGINYLTPEDFRQAKHVSQHSAERVNKY
jgi:hypothetical protein